MSRDTWCIHISSTCLQAHIHTNTIGICVTVYAECIYVLTEYVKYLNIRRISWLFSLIKCGWLWKEPVGYSECLKWRPFALRQARSRSPHSSIGWSMTFCGSRPSLNEALLEVSCDCSFVNSFLHKSDKSLDTAVDQVQVRAVWRPQLRCSGKFYLQMQSVWEKICYFKHRKYHNLWINNKVRGD